MPMSFSPQSRARVAAALTDLGAVRITTGQPFIYTSGWASPVYIDTRLLMSDVARRTEVMDIAAAQMAQVVRERGIGAIVGAESSGIATAAWLAERLALPMLYLRKRPLGWGSAARLEGELASGARVLYVDDVTTDARSKIGAAQALRGNRIEVDDALVIVDYALYPHSASLLATHTLNLHALTTWADIFAALKSAGRLDGHTERMLTAFSADPVRWSIENGGVGA